MLKYISYQTEKEELEKILNDNAADEELKKMAELELKHLENQHELNEKIKIIFVTKDEADKNAIMKLGQELAV